MSRPVIWLVAMIALIGFSNRVESSPTQTLDLNTILKLIQQQQLNIPNKQRRLRIRVVSSDSDTDSDSDSDDSLSTLDESEDSDNNRFARLRKERIVDLLETVANENNNNNRIAYRNGKKNYGQISDNTDDSVNKRLANQRIIDLIERVANENNNDDRTTKFKGKTNYGQNSYLIRNENYDNSNNKVQKQILEKLFSPASNDENRQQIPKKRLKPNRLTPTLTMDDVKKYYGNKNKNEEATGLEDYSKIYIVLNPQAVQNSKNKNALNDLISKVLSLSSSTSKRESEIKELPRRYKGFVVNENHPKRRYKTLTNKIVRMGSDDIKRINPLAIPLERITAMPT